MSTKEATSSIQNAEPANPVSAPSQFPIRKPDGSQYNSADELHTALQAENTGHFLLGKYGFWHGGIHITHASTPQCVRDEPLRAIADGVVVAYRINRDHLTSNLLGIEMQYSSSFVLIRHDYHSPANAEKGPDKGKQNSLTFYSLYMHLLPWAQYEESAETVSNDRIKFEVGDYLARSAIKGESDCVEYGRIPVGSVFEILEESAPVNDLTYAKGKLISGAIASLPTSKEAWFAYKKSGVPLKNSINKDIWSVVTRPERQTPGYWQGIVRAQVCLWDGLPLYFPPATPNHGAQAGGPIAWGEQFKLCWTSDIEFDSRKILNLQLNGNTVRMAECRFVDRGERTGMVANNSMRPDTFWAVVENQGYGPAVKWLSVEPAEFDKVVLCEHPINAGDPVGYLGLYEVPAEAVDAKLTKHQVHMEVFSADERLDAFLQNQAGLKQGKQYLSLPAGTQLSGIPPNTEIITLTTSHIVEMNKVRTSKDPQGVDWYAITVNENGQHVSGRLRKDAVNSNLIVSPQIISQHDWHKLGYRKVEEHNPDADGYLDPNDMPDFFMDLHREIDANQDGNVSAEELVQALRNPALRDKWSRLIARHCNEWKGGSKAPSVLKLAELCAGSPELVAHEKERMDAMMFWDEVAEPVGLPVDGRVWHFHPVEFVYVNTAVHFHPSVWINDAMQEMVFLEMYDGSIIDDHDYMSAAIELGCEVEAIKAIAITETGGSGSYFNRSGDDKVPAILFERHYFHRLTQGQYDLSMPEISNSLAGGYGAYTDQYRKLKIAYDINPVAALSSASWGRFQIMGDNYRRAGYASVSEFVFDISRSEKNHLNALVGYIKSDGVLWRSLVAKNLLTFAQRYNGLQQRGYDQRMGDNYNLLKYER